MALHSPPVLPVMPPAHPTSRRVLDGILGVFGELLITAGVLLGLYVVWQLFYTDVLSGRSQDAALAQIDWAEPVRVPPITAGTAEPTSGTQTTPGVQIAVIPEELKVYSADGAPVLSTPAEAKTFAAVHVPRWGYGYVKPISQGTDRERVLDRLGIGHYENTAMPGEVGNFAIAGHRTTYGKPFSDINTLEVGDAIVVQTEDAWFVYTVTGSAIERPEYIAAIAPVPGKPGEKPTVASITLTSCHPKFSADKRFIVWGELTYWAPTGHGFPQELVEQT